MEFRSVVRSSGSGMRAASASALQARMEAEAPSIQAKSQVKKVGKIHSLELAKLTKLKMERKEEKRRAKRESVKAKIERKKKEREEEMKNEEEKKMKEDKQLSKEMKKLSKELSALRNEIKGASKLRQLEAIVPSKEATVPSKPAVVPSKPACLVSSQVYEGGESFELKELVQPRTDESPLTGTNLQYQSRPEPQGVTIPSIIIPLMKSSSQLTIAKDLDSTKGGFNLLMGGCDLDSATDLQSESSFPTGVLQKKSGFGSALPLSSAKLRKAKIEQEEEKRRAKREYVKAEIEKRRKEREEEMKEEEEKKMKEDKQLSKEMKNLSKELSILSKEIKKARKLRQLEAIMPSKEASVPSKLAHLASRVYEGGENFELKELVPPCADDSPLTGTNLQYESWPEPQGESTRFSIAIPSIIIPLMKSSSQLAIAKGLDGTKGGFNLLKGGCDLDLNSDSDPQSESSSPTGVLQKKSGFGLALPSSAGSSPMICTSASFEHL